MLGGELDAFVREELVELLAIGLPLTCVGRDRLLLLALALAEVRLAEFAVDVVVSRHDDDVASRDIEVCGKASQELKCVLELRRQSPFGEVSRYHDHLRPQPPVSGQPLQVPCQPRIERVDIGIRYPFRGWVWHVLSGDG